MNIKELPNGLELMILDEDGYFKEQYFVNTSSTTFPVYWTKTRVDLVGAWKAQYQGANIDPDTGEFSGGHWVDTGSRPLADYVAMAKTKQYELMRLATRKINPLQDAVDLEMATEEEEASLKVWKKYRVLLNRIDTSKAPDITWPEQPVENDE